MNRGIDIAIYALFDDVVSVGACACFWVCFLLLLSLGRWVSARVSE